MTPQVEAIFDPRTSTVSYLVFDRPGGSAVVIDPVLDYDPASGRTMTAALDRLTAAVEAQGVTVVWILETHVHADHLTAAQQLKGRVGGQIAIHGDVVRSQSTFAELFDAEPQFHADGSQFDRLLADGERLSAGDLAIEVIHTPGHTPESVSYMIGDAVFVGDTLFMPDTGTARCDFPGGCARTLFRSIRRLLDLPPETRMFVCHDYAAGGRETAWQTTVAEQRAANLHVREGTGEEDYVAMRTQRDAGLSLPQLIIPAVQMNIRAGHWPPSAANGVRYLKVPIDRL